MSSIWFTLRNVEHDTETRVLAQHSIGWGYTITHRQVTDARRRLCVRGCRCGGLAGERGGRWFVQEVIEHDPHGHDGLYEIRERAPAPYFDARPKLWVWFNGDELAEGGTDWQFTRRTRRVLHDRHGNLVRPYRATPIERAWKRVFPDGGVIEEEDGLFVAVGHTEYWPDRCLYRTQDALTTLRQFADGHGATGDGDAEVCNALEDAGAFAGLHDEVPPVSQRRHLVSRYGRKVGVVGPRRPRTNPDSRDE